MKPNLLIIGSHFGIPEHQTKLHALSYYFNITAVTAKESSAFRWTEKTENLETPSLTIHSLLHLGNLKSGTRFIFRGLSRFFLKKQFDFILVESEPWSFLRWQACLYWLYYSSKSRFIEFTWENLERPGMKGFLLDILYRIARMCSDQVIAGNSDAKKLLLEKGFASQSILISPQIGVDPVIYSSTSSENKISLRKKMHLPLDSFIIGFVGRFSIEKGIFDLIQSISSIDEIAIPIELALLGSGELETSLQIEKKDKKWIHLLNPLRQHEVPYFLQCLDLLVLPSKTIQSTYKTWKEQFGHVLIEAMACGIPVIGSRSGAIPEVIQDDELLFNEGSQKELTRLILKMTQNPDFRNIKIHEGHQRIHEQFTHEVIAKKWADFIITNKS